MTDFLTNVAEMALGLTDNKIKPISSLSEAEWLKTDPVQNNLDFSDSHLESNQALPLKEIKEKNLEKNDTQKKIPEIKNTHFSKLSQAATENKAIQIDNHKPKLNQTLSDKIYSKPEVDSKINENLNLQPKLVEVAKPHAFTKNTNLLSNKSILEKDMIFDQNERIQTSKLHKIKEIAPVAQAALYTDQNDKILAQIANEDNSNKIKISNAFNIKADRKHEKIATNIAIKDNVLADKAAAITKSNHTSIKSDSIQQKSPITLMNLSNIDIPNVQLLENRQPSLQLPQNDQTPKNTLPKIKITIQRLHIRAPNKPKLSNQKHSRPLPTISLIDYLNQSRLGT